MNDKIALITGATRGIGKAIAEYLVKSGITVVGTATNEQGAYDITENLKQFNNNNNKGLVLNIAESQSIQTIIDQIKNSLGSEPDILINNAGITKDNLLMRMSEEEWFNVINTNLSGIFRLTKSCIRSMLKKRWGRVINISSVVAFAGNMGQTNYAAAKSGILGFTKSLAQEVAGRGITANIVAPGFIETDMTKSLTPDIKEQLLSKIPMARFGTVDEVAKVVMFLASESSSYVTGNTVHVNGGMLMN